MTTPLTRYEALLTSGEIHQDSEQIKAIQALDKLQQSLLRQDSRSWRHPFRAPAAPRGLYLWGGVGRGKTWMMDLFYETLPFDNKLRIHFHRFMARIHDGLREHKAQTDPLADIARQWARDFRVLCLDEFYVSDIADAMLLSGLLQGLFTGGVTLVTTSNVAPDRLYWDGLQRARFLPAIALLQSKLDILHVGGQQDYRLGKLERSELYAYPLDATTDPQMEKNFERIGGGGTLPQYIRIHGRELQSRRRSDDLIWFDFAELCAQPRSTLDYIHLAHTFNTVLLSNVPVMTDETPDQARRFINLIDEFYDRNVKMLITAEAAIDELYQGKRLAFEFARTRSRLTEMQSRDYLARPHLA